MVGLVRAHVHASYRSDPEYAYNLRATTGPSRRSLFCFGMLKAITRSKAATAKAEAPAPDPFRRHADSLFRFARECCHQHDRFARALERDALDIEERASQILCQTCDEALAKLVDAYEKVVASGATAGDDELMRRSNALWMASREFTRRYRGTDEMTRRLGRHSSDEFETLHAEFELDASALLALRHACEAYQKVRPEAI
jgi:hypothetical protein